MPQRGRVPPAYVSARPRSPNRALPWNLQIVEAERQTTIQSVDQQPDARFVIELIDNAREQATRIVGRMQANYSNVPPSACQIGCAWCCYKSIAVSPPEVLRIVAYLRATLAADDLAALQERLVEQDEQTYTMSSRERACARLPCALLADQRCMIHAVRPLTCAGWNAIDVRECQADWRDPDSSEEITANVVQIEAFQAMRLGIDLGVAELGLESDTLELTGALRIALDMPDALERWLAGQRLFVAAHWDDRQDTDDHSR